MPTERLLIFDELGNAKRVKARLTRFLENEPVSDSDKSNIRTTLGITGNPGSGDLLSANNLDDVASKDTTKLNLEVPDIGLQANQVPLCGFLGDLAFQSAEGTSLSTLKLTDLPTSASGLASGSVWNDSGTLKIVS